MYLLLIFVENLPKNDASKEINEALYEFLKDNSLNDKFPLFEPLL